MIAKIQSLPNELLRDILDIACSDQLPTPHWQQLQLSHVNRRFRGVITSVARLWSHITFKSTVEWAELLLHRSGSHGLIIDLSDHHHFARIAKRCPCPAMVKRTLVHSDRWREVRMGAGFCSAVHRQMNSLLTNIHLPSLRRLILFGGGLSAFSNGTLCRSWGMPMLDHLTCSTHADQILYELPISLKSLRFTVQLGMAVDVDLTLYLLQNDSVAGVDELALKFTSPLVIIVSMELGAVRMKNMRSFTVDFTTTRPNESAETFFKHLDLPALEVFEFKQDRSKIYTPDNSSDEDLLRPYLHGLNWLLVDYHNLRTRYPKLRDIRVTINGVKDEELCNKLRVKLDEKFRDKWFGGDLGITGEEEYTEVVASAPQVNFWIHPKLGPVQSG